MVRSRLGRRYKSDIYEGSRSRSRVEVLADLHPFK